MSLFGTLFSEINISRTSPTGQLVDYIRVPITYSQSEKMQTRVEQAISGDFPSSMTLPVMSFELTTIAYDGERKLTTTGRSAFLNTGNPSALKYQYNPVPYDVGFSLYLWVKNAEDGTKIIEQILPYFTPDFTVTVIMIPELGVKAEIPIILTSIKQEDSYGDDLKKYQPIIWTLDFIIKGNFYGPVKSGPIILFANTNMRVPDNSLTAADAAAHGNTGIIAFSSVYPGQDANGHATSNASITVPANTILATSDFGYITTYGQVLDAPAYFRADTASITSDSGKVTLDQLEKHNY